MAGSVNKWFGAGNLCEDPTGKTVKDSFVCEARIACNEQWTDKQGEKQERTEFVNLVCWGKKGEAMNKWFSKGEGIIVEGKIETQTWEDEKGVKHYKTVIKVGDWYFPPGKKERS